MSHPPRGSLQDAFLLHRRSYRETSQLLDFFTRSHGRITLLGKGIRRQKLAYSAVVWPFVPLAVAWSGRGELPVLVNIERLEPGSGLNDARFLACGLYLNELLTQLLPPGDPHPKLFDLYRDSLQRFKSGCDPASILRLFELSFLEQIGYALMLDRDVESGAPIRVDRFYEYHLEQGPVESRQTGSSIRGSTLLELRDRELKTPSSMNEAKYLMRRMIQHLLGGRSLRSRELLTYSSHR